MKMLTETQLLELLERAFDHGRVSATGPTSVDMAHRQTYEDHRRKICLRILHSDTGGHDGKGGHVDD